MAKTKDHHSGTSHLSSISLPIERAPPLSNSLHSIYLVSLYLHITLIFCINVLNFCNIVLFPCSSLIY